MRQVRTILVIEKNAMIRRGLAEVLQSAFKDVGVREADSVAQAMGEIDEAEPPVLALVEAGPNMRRVVSGLQPLRDLCPGMPVAVLGAGIDRRDILHCLASGLAGAIDKDGPSADVVTAVGQMMAGQVHIHVGDNARSFDGNDPNAALRGVLLGEAFTPRRPDLARLTQRQRNVLDLVALGLSNREIGDRLGLSPSTVKIHVAAVLKALRVRNRAEAVALVLDGGLLADAPDPAS